MVYFKVTFLQSPRVINKTYEKLQSVTLLSFAPAAPLQDPDPVT
jgi:hypothetical protein